MKTTDQHQSSKEKDPYKIDQHRPGAKLDHGKVKAGVLGDFGLALLAIAEIGTHGAIKYTRGGWQFVPEARERYTDAKWRHLLKSRYWENDKDSNLLHESHEAWNTLAALEIKLRNKFNITEKQIKGEDNAIEKHKNTTRKKVRKGKK